jgi:allantoin racemase
VPRLLVIVPAPVAGVQLALRQAQAAAARLPGTWLVEFRPVRASADNQVSAHDYAISEICIMEAGLTAADEGYDAVCIDTVSDSGVDSLRSLLRIPVVAAGRASCLMAAMLGERFSIVTMWDRWRPLYTRTLQKLGLGWRCASIRAAGLVPDSRNLLAGKEQEALPRLLAAARAAIAEDGADVICLGSTSMHQAAQHLAQQLPVPVVNPGPLSYRLAVAMAELGLAHSERGAPSPLVEKKAMIHAMLSAAAVVQGENVRPVLAS